MKYQYNTIIRPSTTITPCDLTYGVTSVTMKFDLNIANDGNYIYLQIPQDILPDEDLKINICHDINFFENCQLDPKNNIFGSDQKICICPMP